MERDIMAESDTLIQVIPSFYSEIMSKDDVLDGSMKKIKKIKPTN